jgi:hypothetical protein
MSRRALAGSCDIGNVAADPRMTATVSSLRYCLTVDRTGVLPSASNEHDGVGLLSLRSIVSVPTTTR